LQLRHRRLRSEQKRGDEQYDPYPIAGSEEEKRLMRARERKAKREHGKKIQELEAAIENNRIELERLTNDPDAPLEDLTSVARERQFLKTQLLEFTAEDVEAKYELRGEDVWYEVGLGCSVLLEELPGRPRVVWSVEGGCCASLRSAWQSSHSVPYVGGHMSGEVDVSRLEYERSIGSKGDGEGRFQGATGIAVDEEHVYVADRVKKLVSVFDRRDGAHVRSWGDRGGLEFEGPYGVAVDDTHVYVADSSNRRVQVLTKAGAFVRSIGSHVAGESPELDSPTDVSVFGEHLVVSNYRGNYVSVFGKNCGSFVRRIGGRGSGQGQFNRPYGVAFDGDHVYVADRDNHRVQVLTKEGVFVRTIGRGRGSGPGQMQRPCGVAVDEEYIYVCESNNNRLQIFNKADGGYVREVRRDAADSLAAVCPYFLALQGERVFVTDTNNQNVIVFRG
jgi:DNA-binding beta-propeller fold protein YncE